MREFRIASLNEVLKKASKMVDRVEFEPTTSPMSATLDLRAARERKIHTVQLPPGPIFYYEGNTALIKLILSSCPTKTLDQYCNSDRLMR